MKIMYLVWLGAQRLTHLSLHMPLPVKHNVGLFWLLLELRHSATIALQRDMKLANVRGQTSRVIH